MKKTNRLNKKIEIWGNVRGENELEEEDNIPGLIKTVWSEIIPQTGALQKQQVNTILTNVTHKIKVRYAAGKEITQDMWFMYKGHRFDIKYPINPYFSNEFIEIFCEEKLE